MTCEVLSRTSMCVSWCLGKYNVHSVEEGQITLAGVSTGVCSCIPSQVNVEELDVERHTGEKSFITQKATESTYCISGNIGGKLNLVV